MRRTCLLIVFAALGLAAALGVTAQPAAAWDIGSLPAPYTVDSQYDASNGDCPNFYVVHWYDQSVRLGYGVNSHGSDCNSQFQHDLDAFVDSTINQTPPVTSTVATTTTAATTTVAPPAPTTVAQPPAPTPTTTATPTDTTATTPACDLACLTARVGALETNYTTLAARVDAIANANTASWDAFKAAIDGGASVSDAALAARSAGLNAIYLL
jgi:hypothetical protein